ncbi:MAG: hypothetical protein LBJ00_08735 [Planctomycetaceae bacterium]|nr:hypothetical protein [Planctomycetaceae bacterium]
MYFFIFHSPPKTLNIYSSYFKFLNLNTQAQQREAVVQGRSLPPIPATV